MTTEPVFPPLMTGLAVGRADPVAVACNKAQEGVDAGLIAWSLSPERLRAALVLAPDVPLESAMAGQIAAAVGFQNALGALAPPETAVHLEWFGGIRVNGAPCGRIGAFGPECAPDVIPGWLVIGLDLTLDFPADQEPGHMPDQTALSQEGCGDVDPMRLLEAWGRHTLVWLNALDEADGRANLHREYGGLVWQIGETVSTPIGGEPVQGIILGIDEHFGMLLETAEGTRLVPLSSLIEEG
ncbi:Bifunctional ligase/repressor BirA [Defluviimonas aquaemixtae]|uniref:Bifunctional ligase/repressor BirA n=1 Tax=Albidovulum aquaemixtae TaxID=1542388 RepID=A0A2R8BKV7_9RHOB|nr:biotin/lipoate--protein ligase family protein [Defluviimonas aquaemixtae]SPH24036.1 Bifunctional ligase/repressor BirA [Defluviimonas aquaemixtae]